MTASLPSLPSLEHLKRQAKDLLNRFQARTPDAVRRVRAHLPRAAHLSDDTLDSFGLKLSEAQFVLAREYDFPSWPRLKRHVESLTPDPAVLLDAFKIAVQEGDSARLNRLLKTHADLALHLNAPLFAFDSPAILIAAGRQDRGMVRVLLKYGADINARSHWWAGGFGVLPHSDPDFASFLVGSGATIDIWAAAGIGRLDRLEELLNTDPALANARGGDGQTPLHFAASIEAARMLLDHGADIEVRDIDHGGTPAQYMAVDRPDICRYLLTRGAEPDIFMAVQLGDIHLVSELLAKDPENIRAKVNAGRFTSGASEGGHIYVYTLCNGRSPLDLAADLGHQDIYRFLVELSSPVEQLLAACLSADKTAVQNLRAQRPGLVQNLKPEQMRIIADAAWMQKTDAVRLMLETGFDIEARGDNDSTALNRAAVRGFADIVELLVRHGASLEAKNEFGGRPLSACLWGAEYFRDPRGDYVACVKRLLAAGAPLADVHYPCVNRPVNTALRRYLEDRERTSVIAAIQLGDAEQAAALLRGDPAVVNAQPDGILPLCQAVRSNQPEIVRQLMAAGADPGLIELYGELSATGEALKNGSSEIREALGMPAKSVQ